MIGDEKEVGKMMVNKKEVRRVIGEEKEAKIIKENKRMMENKKEVKRRRK